MKYEYTHFIPENVAPKGATRIVVKSGNTEICSIPASRFGSLTPPKGVPLYSFGLVSDCHTFYTEPTWNGNKKLTNALSYFATQGCIMVIGCGDFTQTGFYLDNKTDYNESQMLNYKSIIDQCPIPVYEIFGNHENYHGKDITENLARAKELTHIPHTAYTVSSAADSDTVDGTVTRPNRHADIGDDMFFMMSQTNQGLVMSYDDFVWLGHALEANKRRRCFICVHSYMEGDSGDADNRRENAIFDNWAYTSQFVSLLQKYPNVILFHGHSHMKLGHQEVDPIANYATVKGYQSVHVPSLGMPRDIDSAAASDKDTPEDLNGSQGYTVDVYPDCIVLNGYDFTNDSCIPLGVLQIRLPL